MSGVFYTIDKLPSIFQTISYFNPFFHIINIFRYGFLGASDGDISFGIIYLPILSLIGWFIAYILYKNGYKNKNLTCLTWQIIIIVEKYLLKEEKEVFYIHQKVKRYLDFVQGIAVNSLGHSNSHLNKALSYQSKRVWHVSNAFEIPEGKTCKKTYQKNFCRFSHLSKFRSRSN